MDLKIPTLVANFLHFNQADFDLIDCNVVQLQSIQQALSSHISPVTTDFLPSSHGLENFLNAVARF